MKSSSIRLWSALCVSMAAALLAAGAAWAQSGSPKAEAPPAASVSSSPAPAPKNTSPQALLKNIIIPGAGGIRSENHHGASHGWMIVQSTTQWALIHVPSRVDGDISAPGVLAASGGSVRLVSSFVNPPAALAASDDTVYMVFETSDRAGRVTRRDVRSVTAVRSGLGSLWRFEPDGDLATLPNLPPDGVLLGVACVEGQLTAIIDDSSEANPTAPRAGVLHRDRWMWSPLPAPLAASIHRAGGVVRVLSTREGVCIAASAAGLSGASIESAPAVIELWTGKVKLPESVQAKYFSSDDDAPVTMKPSSGPRVGDPAPLWSWQSRKTEIGSAHAGDLASGTVIECAGSLLWAHVTPAGHVQVAELSAGVASPMADFPDVTLPVSITSLGGDGRVVLVWSDLAPPSASPKNLEASAPKRTYEVREISAATGRVLYEGPAKSLGPVSPTDLRILSTALLVTMAIALLLVLRPDPSDGVVVLPEGFALAEPSRRFFAALIDLFMAWWIASALWGVDVGDAVSPANMVGGGTWIIAGTSLIVGLVMGTIGEWKTGRSPGKLLTSCEVASVAGIPAPGVEGIVPRPTFWRALERNSIKWLLPPVAMLGLFDSQGRHRADMMARTVVVVRFEPETGDDGFDG